MACATVVGDNTQQRPGLRGTPVRAGEAPAIIRRPIPTKMRQQSNNINQQEQGLPSR